MRIDPDRRAKFGDRLLQLPLVRQGDAQADVGLGSVGLEPDRRTIRADRLIQVSLLSQGVAKVEVGRGIVRV